MCRAFPGSDYYEDSVTIGLSPRRPSRVPLTSGVGLLILHSVNWEFVQGHQNLWRGHPLASNLLAGSLLILAGLSLGAAFTDWADSPRSAAAFLDEGWVRSLVDGRGWIFMLLALLVYAGRLRVVLQNRQLPRAGRLMIPIELVAVSILAALTALGLSWLSVQFIPCVLEARC